MANLQIKGIEEEVYSEIERLATSENRSVSQQVLFVIREYMSRKAELEKTRTPAQVLLELSGSWEDERETNEIIMEIKDGRKDSKRLQQGL